MPDALHPSLAEIARHLERERQHLLAVWGTVPPEDRERRPAADEWTPAEVLEHLRLTEGGTVRLLARRLERAREAGLGPEPDPTPRPADGGAFEVAAGGRFVAPEPVRPAADVPADGLESGLAATRAALGALMADAGGQALGQVRAVHPRFGDVDMYQWLGFVAWHERRHAAQLERVRDALAGPGGGGGLTAPRGPFGAPPGGR